MTITRRIIIAAAPVVRARRFAVELIPQLFSRVTEKVINEPPESVQSIIPVNIGDPAAIPAGTEPTPDYYDILDDGTTPTEGYVVSYEATYDGTTFTVERDLFGPGDFPHNYGGWPMPGELYP